VDLGIDAVAGANATSAALLSLVKGGRLVVAGLTSQEDRGRLDIPVDQLVLTELSIVGTLGNPHADYPELLGLVATGKLAPSLLIYEQVALGDVQRVFDRMPAFATNGFVLITQFD
jgi:propanol-preferring alcohol dehydrogenase